MLRAKTGRAAMTQFPIAILVCLALHPSMDIVSFENVQPIQISRANPTEDKQSPMFNMGLPSCPSRKPSCENLFNLREHSKDTGLPDRIHQEISRGEQLRSHSFDQSKTRWSSTKSLTARDALERFAEDANPDFSKPIHPTRNSMVNDSSFRANNPFLKPKRWRWSATPMS